MRQGFTLLELSIVLVIIGLIIGGITAGQELIRSAELNAVNNQINQYRVALNTFKLKYNQLPGDMTNAQSYWPSCVDNATNVCNGNGNGIVQNATGAAGEIYRFWQHLSLAEVIDGSYDGAQVSSPNEDTYPFLLNMFLGSVYWTAYDDKTDTPLIINKQFFQQSFDDTEIDELTMIRLDTKFDDALPESGRVRLVIGDGSNSACLTNTSPADYDYTASGDFTECYPSFTWD